MGTRWLDDEEQRTWRDWLTVTALLSQRLERELEDASGLTMSEYEVLVRLSESESRSLRMSQLATGLVHSRSRLTHTVSRMEERGLVRRVPCPDDGRGIDCQLTEQGWEVLVAAAPGHVESVRRHLFDPLAARQVAALCALLRDLREDLEA